MTDSAGRAGHPGGLRVIDQVARLEQFRESHPGVEISCDQRTREWAASWTGGKLSKVMQLKVLLDTLERIPEVTRMRQGL